MEEKLRSCAEGFTPDDYRLSGQIKEYARFMIESDLESPAVAAGLMVCLHLTNQIKMRHCLPNLFIFICWRLLTYLPQLKPKNDRSIQSVSRMKPTSCASCWRVKPRMMRRRMISLRRCWKAAILNLAIRSDGLHLIF